MLVTAEPVARLIDEFSKLPGVGPKTAQRLTFFLLRASKEQSRALAHAIVEMKDRTLLCSVCFNITEHDPCPLCAGQRDRSQICVVEEPLDVLALERTREFKGLYHVLHGALAPIDGIGPDDLKIRELLQRLRQQEPGCVVEEVIVATNPNLEGEATAMYLQRLIGPLGIRVTRLARGLPMGADLEYADEVTLTRALQGRREIGATSP
jgi:recombination protein RecR